MKRVMLLIGIPIELGLFLRTISSQTEDFFTHKEEEEKYLEGRLSHP